MHVEQDGLRGPRSRRLEEMRLSRVFIWEKRRGRRCRLWISPASAQSPNQDDVHIEINPKDLALPGMEAEQGRGLPSASRRPRRADGASSGRSVKA